jgi:glycosyltransferase involved in cell wall biosynthesis
VRILRIIGDIGYNQITGPARHAFLLTKGLAERDNQTTVLAFNAESFSQFPNIELERCRLLFTLWNYNFSADMFLKGISKRFDLVHAHGYRNFQSDLGSFLSKIHGRPLVVTAHGSIGDPFKRRWEHSVYDKLTEQRTLRMADAIVATSQAEARDIVSVGIPSSKVVIIPHGIQIPKRLKKSKVMKKSKIVLTVSRLTFKNNLEYALRAFALALKRDPELLYVIVGDEKSSGYFAEERNYKANLVALCEELGISDRVIFKGWLTGDALWEEYECADLFLWPSRYDNFAHAIVEAAHFGLPIVSTRVGVATEVLEDNLGGILVDHDDICQLSDSIVSVIGNEKVSMAMGEHNLKKSEEFSIDKMTDRYLELYRNLSS